MESLFGSIFVYFFIIVVFIVVIAWILFTLFKLKDTMDKSNTLLAQILNEIKFQYKENNGVKKPVGIAYCFDCKQYEKSSGKCKKTGFDINKQKREGRQQNPCELKYYESFFSHIIMANKLDFN